MSPPCPLASTKLDPVDVPASIAQSDPNDQSRAALIEAFARLLKPNDPRAQPSTSDKAPAPENEITKPKPRELEPELVGMSAAYKSLYSGKEDDQGRFQWQDTIPDDVLDPVEDAETQKLALLLRYVKVYSDPRKTLGLHSVVVQSPLLKEALETILAGYPGVTVGLQRLEFSGKFEPLIHRFSRLEIAIDELKDKLWSNDNDANGHEAGHGPLPPDQMTNGNERSSSSVHLSEETPLAASTVRQEYGVSSDGVPDHSHVDNLTTPASTDNGEVKKVDDGQRDVSEKHREALKLSHMQLLHECILKEFNALLTSSQDMMAQSVMTFEHLWTIFQPGGIIFCREDQQERAFKLKSTRYGFDERENPVFWLTFEYVDYTGSKYGFKTQSAKVYPYLGTRPISSLAVYPLSFHPHKEDVTAKLIARGDQICRFAGTHYKAYEGRGWCLDHYGEKEWASVKGRIIIDATGWNRYVPNHAVHVTPFGKSVEVSAATRADMGTFKPRVLDWDDSDDDESVLSDGLSLNEGEEGSQQPLTDEQKLVCTPLVRAYALKEKRWLNMFASSVHDIKFNSQAFESLVLPESQKELVLGFTDSQQSVRNTYDDVIEGKGRGIIILLCGPPGVGKTLTAESVSEHMQVPLFTMSAGDLGADSRHIESRLLEVLGMCTRWNAICLLDEAEIFLEARSLHELERNRIVSVFLRTLEYHEGIMFLTTNLVNHFDPAFQSRIHISLDYPELSSDSRLTIWRNFLKQHDIAQAKARTNPPKNPISSLGSRQDQKELNNKTSEADALSKLEARTKPHAITERQMESLSLLDVNGRQIKNILKTSQLLANRKAEALKHAHITTVLEVTQHLHNHTKANDRTRNSLFA